MQAHNQSPNIRGGWNQKVSGQEGELCDTIGKSCHIILVSSVRFPQKRGITGNVMVAVLAFVSAHYGLPSVNAYRNVSVQNRVS